jgi:hypothetical protein
MQPRPGARTGDFSGTPPERAPASCPYLGCHQSAVSGLSASIQPWERRRFRGLCRVPAHPPATVPTRGSTSGRSPGTFSEALSASWNRPESRCRYLHPPRVAGPEPAPGISRPTERLVRHHAPVRADASEPSSGFQRSPSKAQAGAPASGRSTAASIDPDQIRLSWRAPLKHC